MAAEETTTSRDPHTLLRVALECVRQDIRAIYGKLTNHGKLRLALQVIQHAHPQQRDAAEMGSADDL